MATLEGRFGRYGVRLYELARGIDNREVVPDRPTQSISAEDTFELDVLLAEMEPMNLINFQLENGVYIIAKVLDSGYLTIGNKKLAFARKA